MILNFEIEETMVSVTLEDFNKQGLEIKGNTMKVKEGSF